MKLSEAEAIFNQALELATPEERAAYVKGACGTNATLREKVERLLQAHAASPEFLATEPGDRVMPVVLSEGPGSVIGRYKLLQKIGEGGMGVVYMAEQTEPVRRKVALKIIKLGMDTKQVIARFEAERQALALMDHPNIAKVLDAGATGSAESEIANRQSPILEDSAESQIVNRKSQIPSGRPYFVMDLVQGVPITEYCDKNHLSTQERLELFIPVCQAIQHAHQKGVIHRDIKPSNVMVTLHDGKPVPKVIDFGIAKAINQRLTEKTLFTNYATMIGTPAYMSPEQAEMSGLDVDTRTDVYALGVLLYELLTGTTPFLQKELLSVSYGEMQRIIAEKEPEKPSTRLNKTLAAQSKSATAKSALRIPQSAIDQDLDWIVMKALEKDRVRRYETVNGLVADIHRHLHHEPVSAAAPTLAYQFQKFYRRRRLLVNAAASIAALLVLGILATTWQAVRATRAERAAMNAQVKAQSAAKAEAAQRAQAELARQRADDEKTIAQRNAYVAAMTLAPGDWENNNYARLRQSLADTESYSDKGFEWYYWQRMTHLDLMTLRGHSAAVQRIRFTPDGQRLVSQSADGTVKVWDPTTGRELKSVTAVALFSDASRVITREGTTVKIRELETGRELLTLSGHTNVLTAKGTTNRVTSAFSSANNRRIATMDLDRELKVWDADTGREIATLNGATNILAFPDFSPDGERIVTSSFTGLTAWNATNGRQLYTSESEFRLPRTLFSPDSQLIASGLARSEASGAITIRDAATGSVLFTLKGHTQGGAPSTFSRDGQRLASTSSDGTIKLWDATNGRELVTIKAHPDGIGQTAFSPDGQRIVSTSSDGTIKLWGTANGRELAAFKGHSEVTAMAFSPDGRRIVSGGHDGAIKLWDATANRESLTLQLQGVRANFAPTAAISPDGRLIAGGGNGGVVKVWDAASGREIRTLREPVDPREWGVNSSIRLIQFTSDSQRILCSSRDAITVWDAASGRELVTLPGLTNNYAKAFFRDGKRFASRGVRGKLIVGELASGREPLTIQPEGELFQEVAFSPDGQHLALGKGRAFITQGDPRHTVSILDATTGRELLTLAGGGVGMLVFSEDGRMIASPTLTGIGVWDTKSGQELLAIEGFTQNFLHVAFSPDSRRIIAGCRDGTIKIWETVGGRELSTFRSHDTYVTSVAFSRDGQRLVSASADGTIKILEAASPEQVSAWLKAESAASAKSP